MRELHERVAGHLDALDSVLGAELVVHYGYPALGRSALAGPGLGSQHPGISGQPVRLPLYLRPVDAPGPGGDVLVRRDVAFVQDLVSYSAREGMTLLHHRILPGYLALGHVGVVVVVAFAHYLVVHGVVKQFQTAAFEQLEFSLTGRQETQIKMRGLDHHPVGLCRIERSQRCVHVVYGIRVFQLGPEHYHLMSERRVVGLSLKVGDIKQASVAGSGEEQHGCIKEEVFHSAVQFSAQRSGLASVCSRINRLFSSKDGKQPHEAAI